MSEAQRRYLFRILAGHGYKGRDAEEFLGQKFGVAQLQLATRSEASALIDALLKADPQREAAMEPLTLSVSQVNAYLGCSLKYRFQYVDRIPRPFRAAALAFGTSVHAAIEWIQRERLASREPTPPGAVEMFEADWYVARPHGCSRVVQVIDEVGYLTVVGGEAANLMFQVVNGRYLHRRPMLFTTNKPPAAWGLVLHDPT